ncbi:MAG: CpsD/CapB family tyrosine-protein kinase [Hyphomonadaceae bacterium]
MRRGLGRQALLFVLAAAILTGLGVAYDVSGGVPVRTALFFWAPLGAAGALTLTFVRELGRNTVTSLSSFGRYRGYSILGAAPDLTPRALRQLPPDQRTPQGCLVHAQASAFASAFRDLQGAISRDKLVAFTGSLPGEGATTAALCTAISAAQQGRNVIVIDCDLKRRSLTRALGFDPDEGVLDACENPGDWQSYVGEEDETGLHFMPAARPQSPWRGLVSTPGFPVLLTRLQNVYDLIILDCPPTLSSPDAALIAGLTDTTVLVTAWDRTPLSAVRNAMRALHRRPRGRTGVYVNRVPPEYRFGRLRGE